MNPECYWRPVKIYKHWRGVFVLQDLEMRHAAEFGRALVYPRDTEADHARAHLHSQDGM